MAALGTGFLAPCTPFLARTVPLRVALEPRLPLLKLLRRFVVPTLDATLQAAFSALAAGFPCLTANLLAAHTPANPHRSVSGRRLGGTRWRARRNAAYLPSLASALQSHAGRRTPQQNPNQHRVSSMHTQATAHTTRARRHHTCMTSLSVAAARHSMG